MRGIRGKRGREAGTGRVQVQEGCVRTLAETATGSTMSGMVPKMTRVSIHEAEKEM